VRCRPVGVLRTEDESGGDEKILAVRIGAVDAFFADVRSHEELPTTLKDQIDPFFSHYKDLERGKWVRLSARSDAAEAAALIAGSIERERAQTPVAR
jgi:inorganic pyrophosphatase